MRPSQPPAASCVPRPSRRSSSLCRTSALLPSPSSLALAVVEIRRQRLAVLRVEAVAADPDFVAVQHRVDAASGERHEVGHRRRDKAALFGGADDFPCERVLRAGLERGGIRQQVGLTKSLRSGLGQQDVGDTRLPRRQRSRLVEDHARTAAMFSRYAPPLRRMPCRAALAIAESTAAGVEMTSAHGDATTSTTMP